MRSGSRSRAVVLLLGGALVAACGESKSSSAEAARADSSAAGYAVGSRQGTATRSDSLVDTTRTVAQSPLPVTAPPPAGAAPNAGSPAAGTTGRAGSTGTPTKSTPVDTMRKAATVVTKVSPNGGAAAKTDSVVVAPPATGPVHVNEFLAYDTRSRTVSLQLIAGYNGLNGSLNYNGATNGSHGISVPLGWRIHVAVMNRDSDLQHSAIVLREVLPPPIEPSEPAFSGAALPDLGEGLQDGDTGTLDFLADQPGQFMIACGVPGHAQAGMWLKLVVTKGLEAPIYR